MNKVRLMYAASTETALVREQLSTVDMVKNLKHIKNRYTLVHIHTAAEVKETDYRMIIRFITDLGSEFGVILFG